MGPRAVWMEHPAAALRGTAELCAAHGRGSSRGFGHSWGMRGKCCCTGKLRVMLRFRSQDLLAQDQMNTTRTRPGHLNRLMKIMHTRVGEIERSLASQQMMMIKIVGEAASRAALCRETPGSLPAAATHVLTCNRGTAVLDAVSVASIIGDLIGGTVSSFCADDVPQTFEFVKNLPELVVALAASLSCLVCCPGAAGLAVCRPGQELAPYATASLVDLCVRMAAHLSAASRWLLRQLQLSMPSGLDWAAVLMCSSEAAVSLLAVAEKWGRTGCWDDVPAAGGLRGWPALASDAAALLHSMAKPSRAPTARRSAAARALEDVSAAAKLQQMLAWVAESPTIATTTAVLTEALPALAALASANTEASQQLALKGGLQEWAPVAEALRRRLPRRMAARLLPMVDAVTAAVAGPPAADKKDALAAAADAAMAALLLVNSISRQL